MGTEAAPARADHHNRLASTGAPLKEPLPPKQAVPPDHLFLPTLRHGTMGFEALGVLIQYLVCDLDAFATPDLKKQVEKMKVEYNNTKRSLDELQLKNIRLEENLSQEKTSYQQKILLVETKHGQEIAELVSHHEEQLADYEKKMQLQVDEMKGRYEGELSRLDRLNAERVEALLEDGQARLEQANAEHLKELERLQVETLRREAELQRRLTGADTELAGLKEQARRFVDGLQQDRDTKLQATAGHCRELQDEVESLRTVLDLRREEIAELRRQNLELARDAGELPQVLQKNAALLARVEDLQVQLQRKSNFERQLSQENKLLMESYHQETAQKKRLSLHNEELQWKLKQNAEVVNAFAAIAGSPISIPLLTVTNGNRKSSDAEYFDSSFNNLFNRSFNQHKENNHSSVSGNSPPASPKVKAVVEKGDSVSWVLEMDDAPEEILSRLVRRAGSFRGTTPPPPVSSPAHSRTLPRRPRSKTSSLTLSASAGVIGHGHGRAVRPRSVSTDSVEVDYRLWSEVPNCSTPVSQLEQSHLPLDEELLIHVSNKVSLKRSGDTEDDVRVHQSTNGLAAKRPNAETTLEELQEKSSSMSNSSVSSSCSDGSVNSSGCGSEREYHHRLNGSKNLSDDVLDIDEAEILPLPPLPGSTSDLSLLAACAAAQPSLVPKDSAGEAMISEETSEDENEHEVVNSSDEQSCSDEDSSSECSSGLGCESSRGLTHEDGPKSTFDEVLEGSDQRVLSDHTSKQQYNLLIMSDSTTTTMDISWSEDIELMPSETEG